MLRLSLAARITLIVAIALMITVSGAIALFYWTKDLEGEGARPSARQIASIVELVEQTPVERRALILDALTSRIMNARLETGQSFGGASERSGFLSQSAWQQYAAALVDRHFTITPAPRGAFRRQFPQLFPSAVSALEFHIGLRTGETLIIDTKRPLIVSLLGLPVGFGASLFGAVVALVALLITHREMRPLARLSTAVDRMEPMGKPVFLPMARTTAPEIQSLIRAFNRLQSRLSQLLRARLVMLGGISHDVRTFATRLRLRVDHIADDSERDRAIGDIADMVHLLDDALLASRAGAGELDEELVEFDEIVRSEVEGRRAAGAVVDLHVELDAAGASVLGDRLALRRIVANLTDNALKYGNAAHLSVAIQGKTLVLTVDDEGAGIAPELRELVVEPFVRLEGSRCRQTGGAGLGLAVVRNLVEAHGGFLAIGDVPTGGARLTVRLPAFAGS